MMCKRRFTSMWKRPFSGFVQVAFLASSLTLQIHQSCYQDNMQEYTSSAPFHIPPHINLDVSPKQCRIMWVPQDLWNAGTEINHVIPLIASQKPGEYISNCQGFQDFLLVVMLFLYCFVSFLFVVVVVLWFFVFSLIFNF